MDTLDQVTFIELEGLTVPDQFILSNYAVVLEDIELPKCEEEKEAYVSKILQFLEMYKSIFCSYGLLNERIDKDTYNCLSIQRSVYRASFNQCEYLSIAKLIETGEFAVLESNAALKEIENNKNDSCRLLISEIRLKLVTERIWLGKVNAVRRMAYFKSLRQKFLDELVESLKSYFHFDSTESGSFSMDTFDTSTADLVRNLFDRTCKQVPEDEYIFMSFRKKLTMEANIITKNLENIQLFTKPKTDRLVETYRRTLIKYIDGLSQWEPQVLLKYAAQLEETLRPSFEVTIIPGIDAQNNYLHKFCQDNMIYYQEQITKVFDTVLKLGNEKSQKRLQSCKRCCRQECEMFLEEVGNVFDTYSIPKLYAEKLKQGVEKAIDDVMNCINDYGVGNKRNLHHLTTVWASRHEPMTDFFPETKTWTPATCIPQILSGCSEEESKKTSDGTDIHKKLIAQTTEAQNGLMRCDNKLATTELIPDVGTLRSKPNRKENTWRGSANHISDSLLESEKPITELSAEDAETELYANKTITRSCIVDTVTTDGGYLICGNSRKLVPDKLCIS